MKLSKRLQTVAEHIPKGAVMADIGSDHAYLPCYCVLNDLASAAIAGEITDGPFLSAKQQVEKLNLSSLISVRKGDGLEVIQKGEVNAITIAGMGGSLIAHILESGKGKLTGKERLILQPNIHARHIREWLYKEGYALIKEDILEEDGKCYEVLVAETGDKDAAYKDISFRAGVLVGPFLAKEKTDVFVKKWSQELEHLKKIYQQIKVAAPSIENQQKLNELSERIEILKEVLERG
ncbi:tRNA (adenine(22)-N(1))-methyltransferase TrmK [Bacillus sonorensis]|nr:MULTISPECIES: tRNA (adenine(22)-N(1))-methyltransferase TrmK [Bacillus]MCZ0067443.1 tRNA (adenine(22)-N(1))-methyltransferase TrmK [Bacillus sonorensis]MCZ0071732.1 tRNA (adenine(22)-N(1))-methyltransferase TrmK [Bacillus sonorensis]MCZ0090352.1 tRNA (adenine(22)-N(1))-methyltransferase TrmK [Bacillus sonorensis]MCZ0095973.1 tRNA (adenine(22)-N(1))-methyltransferase TrmK [Bacillus sonorensis]MDR4958997.1 tRNA (adenine(22)-N(1))-methyltransferase TrmK [Bacillus sonorensis]